MGQPECECHGEAMLWNRDVRATKGGRWKCRVAHRERERRSYAKNSQSARAATKLWTRAHPEYQREWRAKTPDKQDRYARAATRKYRDEANSRDELALELLIQQFAGKELIHAG